MKTIIFDFDGTIADTLALIIEIINKLAKVYKFSKPSKKDILRLRGETFTEVISEFKNFGVSLFRIPFLLKEAKEMMEEEILTCKPFSGLVPVLKLLKEKGYRLGILSSNLRPTVEKFLKKNKIELFDFIYVEENPFLLGKADKLKSLIKKYRWESQDVIYIGDETRDIDAAREAGIEIVSVSWGFNSKKILQIQKPDYLIDEPSKLLTTLSSI